MKDKNFNLLFLSNIINKFGDSIDLIAFMWLTYEVTNSAALTGVVAAFNGLPAIVLGLFSGIIADRFDKKKLMAWSDFFRGIMVVLICILYLFNDLNVYILIIATLIISILEILSTPARRAILPSIVEKEDLLKCNSKISSGKLIVQLIGLAVAGTIISKFGVVAAIGTDAATFFISFILLMNIKVNKKDDIRKDKKYSIKSDVKEALAILFKQLTILRTTIIATLVNLFIGPFNLLILNYCINVLGNGSSGQSILNTTVVIGILIVNFLLIKHINKNYFDKLINIGFILLSVSFMLYGINNNIYLSVIITLIYGIGTGFITAPSVTIIQKDTPREHLGKVMSIISLVNESSVPIGNCIAGFLIDKLNVNVIFISFGLAMLLSLVIIQVIFNVIKK